MDFENKFNIGTGLYSVADIARILRLPYAKINRWIEHYWDGKLGQKFQQRYSWKTENARMVSFHTLIELYIMHQLTEVGVKPKEILKAHEDLSKNYGTPFPFANKLVLAGIRTDKKHIYFQAGENTITLDGTKQLNLAFLRNFIFNLDFDTNEIADRFWPLGRDKEVILDPNRRFGQAVLLERNIQPEVLFNHYKAGDPISYIAEVYELSEKAVQDAIDFCQAA
ncbi:MAG TPA: DUF433 domain-containing protein [Bacteroidetes bacterium]|nr:DUF433 domain-containing protein [Bacteroidota bacterium]